MTIDERLRAFGQEVASHMDWGPFFIRHIEQAVSEASERYAAELAKEKERRTYYQSILYHVCNWIDKTLGNSGPHVVSCGQLDAPSDGVQHALDRITRELAASDQRWQERLKAVETSHEADMETVSKDLKFARYLNGNQANTIQDERDRHKTELATEKANWKAQLERVEAEHSRELSIARTNLDRAVSAAYEEASQLAHSQGRRGLAAIIRNHASQLAAKPQEPIPECNVPASWYPETGGECPKPAPKFPDCECGLTEAPDPPAAKNPYTKTKLREITADVADSLGLLLRFDPELHAIVKRGCPRVHLRVYDQGRFLIDVG